MKWCELLKIKNELMQKKNLIFDFDGVIADTDYGRYKLLKIILAKYDIKLKHSIEDIKGISTKKFLKDNFAFLSKPIMQDIISERRNLFFNNLDKYCFVYPGAVETIIDLKKLGYDLYLATSNDEEMIAKLLDYSGLKKIFIRVVPREQSEDYLSGKKNYNQVLAILKKKANDCIVIEDSPAGVIAAKNASIFCIAFNHDNNSIVTEKADIIIKNYSEFRKLLNLDSKFKTEASLDADVFP